MTFQEIWIKNPDTVLMALAILDFVLFINVVLGAMKLFSKGAVPAKVKLKDALETRIEPEVEMSVEAPAEMAVEAPVDSTLNFQENVSELQPFTEEQTLLHERVPETVLSEPTLINPMAEATTDAPVASETTELSEAQADVCADEMAPAPMPAKKKRASINLKPAMSVAAVAGVIAVAGYFGYLAYQSTQEPQKVFVAGEEVLAINGISVNNKEAIQKFSKELRNKAKADPSVKTTAMFSLKGKDGKVYEKEMPLPGASVATTLDRTPASQ